jgi:hypothetical protein
MPDVLLDATDEGSDPGVGEEASRNAAAHKNLRSFMLIKKGSAFANDRREARAADDVDVRGPSAR